VSTIQSTRIFYGWWIVVAAFLNLFFAVGINFYGFPVFYAALTDSLGFSRATLTQGFLLGFLIAGLPFCEETEFRKIHGFLSVYLQD
jgi:hypothetical protein